ncbi:hypothetical protein H1R20_g9871, partial [Candolleomyces eurysporus]
MSDDFDVYAAFHATCAELDWTPGLPPPKVANPAMFIGKVLDLVLAMNHPDNVAILQYAGAKALNDWTGHFTNTTVLSYPQLTPAQRRILEKLPGQSLPPMLPATSTVPLDLDEHEEWERQLLASKAKGKGRSTQTAPGSRLFLLSGVPTDRFFDNSNPPPQKRSKQVATTSRTTRQNADAGPSRSTRHGAKQRQPSPIDIDDESPAPRTSGKQKTLLVSSDEEVSVPKPSPKRADKKAKRKVQPRPIVKTKACEAEKPIVLVPSGTGPAPPFAFVTSRGKPGYRRRLLRPVFPGSRSLRGPYSTTPFPCNYKGCLSDPTTCVASSKNSQKCGPCQDKGYPCSWTYDPHDLRQRLSTFWSSQRQGHDVFHVNALYRQMRDEWESYRTFTLLANREAAKYEATRRALVGLFNQATAEGDSNVDHLVDPSDLAVASTQFPAVLREDWAEVPSVESYLKPVETLADPTPYLPFSCYGPAGAFNVRTAEQVVAEHENVDMTYVSTPRYRRRELEEEEARRAQQEQAAGIQQQQAIPIPPPTRDVDMPEDRGEGPSRPAPPPFSFRPPIPAEKNPEGSGKP